MRINGLTIGLTLAAARAFTVAPRRSAGAKRVLLTQRAAGNLDTLPVEPDDQRNTTALSHEAYEKVNAYKDEVRRRRSAEFFGHAENLSSALNEAVASQSDLFAELDSRIAQMTGVAVPKNREGRHLGNEGSFNSIHKLAAGPSDTQQMTALSNQERKDCADLAREFRRECETRKSELGRFNAAASAVLKRTKEAAEAHGEARFSEFTVETEGALSDSVLSGQLRKRQAELQSRNAESNASGDDYESLPKGIRYLLSSTKAKLRRTDAGQKRLDAITQYVDNLDIRSYLKSLELICGSLAEEDRNNSWPSTTLLLALLGESLDDSNQFRQTQTVAEILAPLPPDASGITAREASARYLSESADILIELGGLDTRPQRKRFHDRSVRLLQELAAKTRVSQRRLLALHHLELQQSLVDIGSGASDSEPASIYEQLVTTGPRGWVGPNGVRPTAMGVLGIAMR